MEDMTQIIKLIDACYQSASAAYEDYKRYTNQIIRGDITDITTIERWMDALIDWNFDHRFISLYKRLCRYLFPKYPQLVGEHVLMFLKLYGEKFMETITMQIKVDSTLYDDANAVLAFLGISVEDAIVIFLQEVASTGKMPFEYSANDVNGAEGKVSVFEDIKTGINQAIEMEKANHGKETT